MALALPLFQLSLIFAVLAPLAACSDKSDRETAQAQTTPRAFQPNGAQANSGGNFSSCSPKQTVHADIVALEQAYILNRFGAFVPGGMLYALRQDVVSTDGGRDLKPGNVRLRSNKRPRPLVLRVNEGECLEVRFQNLLSPAWTEEGGVPLEYDGKLPQHVEARAAPAEVSRKLVPAEQVSKDIPRTRAASFHVNGLENAVIPPDRCPKDFVCGGDGSNIGLSAQQGLVFNPSTAAEKKQQLSALGSLVAPGDHAMLLLHAGKEGTYFAHSMGAPVGGEGDGGQIGLGLFGAVNVEPKDSTWYRSQVTHKELGEGDATARHPYSGLDYAKFAIRDDKNQIIHSDLNAVIVQKEPSPKSKEEEQQLKECRDRMFGDSCGLSFREFTVIMHDEVHAEQAFAELADEDNPLHYVKDGMGINYGVSSMGSLVMGSQSQRGVGVVAKCPECRGEEFFLSSWANGDPALILKWDEKGEKPIGAMYPDDPSNVHHSYLGDPVRFRNIHAGPKETHVFHLHAHQWVLDATDRNSTYLDSQTISPGATFSYGIEFGGSGNRNYTPGDSIFHCHLYPHFAQGMWELWRVHDTFEDGTYGTKPFDSSVATDIDNNNPRWRNLPDAEIPAGTENPAIVPIPNLALAPMPSATFTGYPFYIPGEAGHRPPQPPLDMDVLGGYDAAKGEEPADDGSIVNGGLPRHTVTGYAENEQPVTSELLPFRGPGHTSEEIEASKKKVVDEALAKGGAAAELIARRVYAQNKGALEALARMWNTLYLKPLPHSGTESEKRAMAFHEGGQAFEDVPAGQRPEPVDKPLPPKHRPGWFQGYKAYKTAWANRIESQQQSHGGESEDPPLFYVNGRPRAAGAPYANPCPDHAPPRDYKAAFIQTELTVNRHGWFDPQGRIVILENDIKDIIDPDTRARQPEPLFFRANSGDCINFKSSNFVPSGLNVDDFQVFTPTDTIGQHIHLVKFDVTSSDGSGNGWNYEDTTFSPDEVRERIFAYNRTPNADGSPKTAQQKLKPKAHPLFLEKGDIYEHRTEPRYSKLYQQGVCPDQEPEESDDAYEKRLNEEHPLCGAQRTTQRWWADPILVEQRGPDGKPTGKFKDNTLRTVFTHDHMGPSSHQQHGLYAGLVIEPANSTWSKLDANVSAGDLEVAAKGDEAARKNAEKKLLGGADLTQRPNDQILNAEHVLNPISPRAPLVVRGDGGPTATAANIVSPERIGDPDSHPWQPPSGCVNPDPSNNGKCLSQQGEPAHQTRREFTLAIADFSGVYNTALEPINPETRDVSARRFGLRQVATQIPRPLAISSEDPGTQLVNYRNEPLALRISTPSWNAALGGFDYNQTSCKDGDRACAGDMANGFATNAHAGRDEKLATIPYWQFVDADKKTGKKPGKAYDLLSPTSRSIFTDLEKKGVIERGAANGVMESVERWRRDFNCALYTKDVLAEKFCNRTTGNGNTKTSVKSPPIGRLESARFFGDPATPILTAYEGDPVQIRLIQGAQEAQHVFTMNGVKWHRVPDSPNSGYTNAQPLGISEHFEFDTLVNPIENSLTDYLYFGSSIDQLWDGMWGVMRAYSRTDAKNPPSISFKLGAGPQVKEQVVNPSELPALLPGVEKPSRLGGDRQTAICKSNDQGSPISYQRFDVSVVQVCQLYKDCDQPRGVAYSERFGIYDREALAYVLSREPEECTSGASQAGSPNCEKLPDNHTVLTRLQGEFAAGRPLEPLVLRATAGQCMEINLRNHLPHKLLDGPLAPRDQGGNRLPDAFAYHNFLPMITDGFNLNQFRMSSTVGLSAPRVAQHPLHADGSNVGLNAAMLPANRGEDTRPSDWKPGSLVPPCLPGKNEAGDDLTCRKTFYWSARDFERDKAPLELGALPLRSFGDAIKHPTHGLVGALVIEPPGSVVCKSERRWPAGLRTRICIDNKPAYLEQILVMQDAVSAVRGGFPVSDLSGAEEPDDYGVKAINYKTEPLWARRGNDPSIDFGDRNEQDYSQVFSSDAGATPGNPHGCRAGVLATTAAPTPCDPETPVIEADAGETLRLHFVHPGGHTRQQGLTVNGHAWNPYPWVDGSRKLDSTQGSSIRQGTFNGFGPMMGISLELKAGGERCIPGEYLLHSQASFLLDGGLWGILRVKPAIQADSGEQHGCPKAN